jgi:hypothetical protein
MANFMKVWGVASEDVGSRESCRQAPMEGFTAVLDRHIPYLLFLDGFSIKREYEKNSAHLPYFAKLELRVPISQAGAWETAASSFIFHLSSFPNQSIHKIRLMPGRIYNNWFHTTHSAMTI